MYNFGFVLDLIHRQNLEEKSWNDPAKLSDDDTEELIQGLIDSLNKNQDMNVTWTCAGDTLVATARQRLDEGEFPIFFICSIRRCLQLKEIDRSIHESRSSTNG